MRYISCVFVIKFIRVIYFVVIFSVFLKKKMYIPGDCKNCEIMSSAAKALNVSELENLEQNCVNVKYVKGDTIFKQGIFSSNIMYLTAGVAMIRIEEDEKEQIIKFVKAPAFIGIPTTFKERINQYSATVISDASLCIINTNIFKNFIFNNGKFAYEIIIDLCKNELELFNHYVSKSQKNINGRLADTLLFFANDIFESDKFTIPVSRADLGNYVNTTRESISRTFSEFAEENIIKLSGKKISILNKERLKEISLKG